MRLLRIALLLLALAAVAGPQAATAAKPQPAKVRTPTAESLLGKKLTSIKVTGAKVFTGLTIGLEFFMHADREGAEKRPTVRFHAGCNTHGAPYEVRRGRLVLTGPAVGTSMLCRPKRLMRADRRLIRTLRKGAKARVKRGRLILTRPAEGLRIVLAPGKVRIVEGVIGARPARIR